MAIATPLTQAGLEQIISKADSELALLESESIALTRQIDAATAELDVINSRQDGRFQSLQMAEQTVRQLKADLAAAQTRSRLAENTLASDPGEASVKDSEKRLAKAESDLSKLRGRLSKEPIADDQREAAAQSAIDQTQELLASLRREHETTIAARNSAYQDLGQL